MDWLIAFSMRCRLSISFSLVALNNWMPWWKDSPRLDNSTALPTTWAAMPSARPACAPSVCANCWLDRKSTRLNSSHSQISHAVFCFKKKMVDFVDCDEFGVLVDGDINRTARGLF